jgi:hypothetical protein
MKTIYFHILILSTLFFFFESCNKEDDVASFIPEESGNILTRSQVDIPDFEVENGCLKFQNESDYVAMYSSLLSQNKAELLTWSASNGYTSLLARYTNEDSIAYATFVPDHDYEPGEEFIDTSERVLDPQLATLFNSDGLVLVGDTVFKIRGIYVYKIPDGDSAKANEIDNATDDEALDYIPHFRHTTKLQSRLRNYERSPVISVTSSRREFVNFEQHKSEVTSNVFKFRSWMSGRAQCKTLGIWMPDFEDEIVSGVIQSTAACYIDGSYVTVESASGVDKVTIEAPPYTNNNMKFRFTVVHTFTKNAIKGQETYTNVYYVN